MNLFSACNISIKYTILQNKYVGAAPITILAAKAMESIGRNPEAAGAIRQNMILAIAFAEAIAIYALVVAFLIIFVA